jgi:hypothetical protein
MSPPAGRAEISQTNGGVCAGGWRAFLNLKRYLWREVAPVCASHAAVVGGDNANIDICGRILRNVGWSGERIGAKLPFTARHHGGWVRGRGANGYNGAHRG